MSRLWIVDVKGGPNKAPFEISVLRADNEHGKRSYGWFDADKLYISSDGGPCHYTVSDRVWKALLGVAQATADLLNLEATPPRSDIGPILQRQPVPDTTPANIEAIRSRVADGVFLGGDYQVAYAQYLVAHRDRVALLARLDELEEKQR